MAIEILKDENEYKSILSPNFENKQQLGMKISMLDKRDVKRQQESRENYFYESVMN